MSHEAVLSFFGGGPADRLVDYNLVSTLKIVFLVYLPAFLVALLWFTMPLQYYLGIAVAVFTQWFFSYVAWMMFYDFVWPGCPNPFLFSSLILFCLSTVAGIFGIWYLDEGKNKQIYLLLALVELLCSTFPYVFHIIRTRYLIKIRNRKLIRSKSERFILREKHWSSWIYNTFYRLKVDQEFKDWFSKHEWQKDDEHREERNPDETFELNDFEVTDKPKIELTTMESSSTIAIPEKQPSQMQLNQNEENNQKPKENNEENKKENNVETKKETEENKQSSKENNEETKKETPKEK